MSSRNDAWRDLSVAEVRPAQAAQSHGAAATVGVDEATGGQRWIPWTFAAKTTASGLLALLVAFTFDLDQPRWSLLTVFIIARPQTGFVLAKGFYRVIGTLVGAAVALLLVSLFAQERVLFLGALAAWIGLCTFGSVNGRNFAAYGFVLSGYTAAIVGVPGALDAGNAFFIAVARVTEISLGILATGVISHVVLPVSLADALRRAVATARADLGELVASVLARRDVTALRSRLLDRLTEVENLRASAIFEDSEVRAQSGALHGLVTAMLGLFESAHLLDRALGRPFGGGIGRGPQGALAQAATAIDLWQHGALDAAGLQQRLLRATAGLPLARDLYRRRLAPDEQVFRGVAEIGRLREFTGAFVAFAQSCELVQSGKTQPAGSAHFTVANDHVGAAWAGLRAALALLLTGALWIVADWPSGTTATILAALVTARLATMEHAVAAATGASLLFALATVPVFIVVEVVLPDAAGFPIFALVVAPILFLCAYMMANKKTAGLGFLAGLYFAYVGGFQNRMAYDPVAFLNVSIAIIVAVATAGVLFAVVRPDTPQAARRRFARVARRMFECIARSPRLALTDFETAIAEALSQLRQGLRHDRREDVVALEAGIALLGIGRELIRIRDSRAATLAGTAVADDVVRYLGNGRSLPLEHARRAASEGASECLAALRDGELGVAAARAASRAMVALTAVRDGLERCGGLFLADISPADGAKGAMDHAA